MDQSVILSACRTPIGKFQGGLASVAATDLGAVVVREALRRADLSGGEVDEVIFGNVLSSGAGQAPARQAALRGGVAATSAAVTVNKVCGSGLKAVMLADQAVRAGDARVVVAGGLESMSRAPYLLDRVSAKVGNRALVDTILRDGLVCPFSGKSMGTIADQLARAEGISREAQDRYACESHRRAVAAVDGGRFKEEIVAVSISRREGIAPVAADEGPRADTTVERLGKLPPAFDSQGTVTAGNASMIGDGAAAVVVASGRFVEQAGRKPLARVIASATVGGDPEQLFLTPAAAVKKVLDRAGLAIADVDLFEINEAFAAQMEVCLARLQLPRERVNVNGGAIALGHPIGASGARALVTLLHAMQRQDARHGLVSLCLGGGNAVAMIVRRET